MTGQVLRLPVELVVATATEEGQPKMLPRMTIGGESILIHDPTVGTESHLLSLVVIIVDGHARQAVCLVEFMDNILLVVLKRHARGYDSN